MNSIILNNKDIRKLKKLRVKHAKESVLYLCDEKLYKILIPDRRKGRDETIKKVHDNPIEGLPYPYELLLDETNSFIGYSMSYFKGYKTLEENMKSQKDFNVKRQLSFSALSIMKDIIESGFVLKDIHRFNILTNNTECKICDFDGMESINTKPSIDEFYSVFIERNIMLTFGLETLIRYLLNDRKDYYGNVSYTKILELYNFFPSGIIREFLNGRLTSLLKDNVSPEEILNEFDEENINILRRVLK